MNKTVKKTIVSLLTSSVLVSQLSGSFVIAIELLNEDKAYQQIASKDANIDEINEAVMEDNIFKYDDLENAYSVDSEKSKDVDKPEDTLEFEESTELETVNDKNNYNDYIGEGLIESEESSDITFNDLINFNLIMSSHSITPDDPVTFSIEIDNDLAIKDAWIVMATDQREIEYVYLDNRNETEQLEGTFNYSQDDFAWSHHSNFRTKEIILYLEDDRSVIISQDDFDFGDHVIAIDETAYDINQSSNYIAYEKLSNFNVSLSNTLLTPDTTVKFQLEVDYDLEVREVLVELDSEQSIYRNISLIYNDDTGLFEGSFSYDKWDYEWNQEKEFYIDHIKIAFENGKFTIVDQNDYDFSQLIISVDEAEYESDRIDWDASFEDLNYFSVNTSNQIISPELEIVFSVEVDYKHRFIEGFIDMDSDNWNYREIYMEYDEETGLLSGGFTYTQDDYWRYRDTEFMIDNILLIAENGTSIRISNHEYDFSSLNVTIDETKYRTTQDDWDDLYDALDELDLQISDHIITPDTEVNYSLEIDYETPLSYVVLWLSSDNWNYHRVDMEYNDETSKLIGTFAYSLEDYSRYRDTEFQVDYLDLYFPDGKYVEIDNRNHDFSSLTLAIDETTYPTSSDDWYVSYDQLNDFQMEISSHTITPNNGVSIYIDLDYDISVKEGYVTLRSDQGNSLEVYLYYNEQIGRLEGKFHYSQSDYSWYSDTKFDVDLVEIYFDNGSLAEIDLHDYDFTGFTIEIDESMYDTDDYHFDYEININDIEYLNIDFDKSTFGLDEKVKVTLDIKYETELTYVVVWLESDNNNITSLQLIYNEDTGLYEGDFSYNTNRFSLNEDREFKVKTLMLDDAEGKYIDLTQDSGLLTDKTIELVGVEYYYGEPTVDIDSLRLSSNHMTNSNKIQLSIDIFSEVELRQVIVKYEDEDGNYGAEGRLERFKNTNTYYGVIYDNYYGLNSTNKLKSIEISDIYGNHVEFAADDFNTDLSEFDITIENYNNPYYHREILADTLKLSRNLVTVGDYVEYEVEIESNDLNFGVRLVLVHEDGQEFRVIPFRYDENKQLFKARWDIHSQVLSGEWNIDEVIIDDSNYGSGYGGYLGLDLMSEEYTLKVTGTKDPVPAPEVNVNVIELSKDEVSFGDSVTISLDMDIVSEAPINEIQMIYQTWYVYQNIPLIYNSQTKKYEAIFKVDNPYILEEVEFDRLFVNSSTGYGVNVDLREIDKAVSFKVINIPEIDEDYNNSFIELIDIQTSRDSVQSGETFELSIKIENPDSIGSAYAYFTNPVNYTQNELKLIFNYQTGYFEGEFEPGELTEAGIWNLSLIVLNEKNSDNYYYLERYNEKIRNKMRIGDFFVKEASPSLLPPFIDMNSLQLNRTVHSVGETVDISLKVTGILEMDSVKLHYLLPKSGYGLPIELVYNHLSKMYEGSYDISDKSEAGKWILDKITATDVSKNKSVVENTFKLSTGDFIVNNEPDVFTVLDILEDELSVLYDSESNTLKAQTKVTHPELIDLVILTYLDTTTQKFYYVELYADKTSNSAANIMTFSSSLNVVENYNDKLYEGSLELPEDVSPQNLKLVNVAVTDSYYNYSIVRRSSHIDPTSENMLDFGDITNIDEDKEIPVDEEEKPEISDRFTDVPKGQRGHEIINRLAETGIINGYQDGTFRPNNNITRAQAAVMIVRAANIDIEGKSSDFNDVPESHSAYRFISAAQEAGIIRGYSEDNTYRPNDFITRGQIAVMLTRAFELEGATSGLEFTDVSASNPQSRFINALSSQGVINGYQDGTFKPGNNTTRVQFSTMIDRLISQ